MKSLVIKFGGSCLATPEKIRERAQLVKSFYNQGYSVICVVSAMGNTTNDLVKLAYQVSQNPQRRELDMLLTTGERVSMALMSMVLNDLGCPSISFTGSQAGIMTATEHNNAKILELKPIRVVEELNKNKIVILAGFQGVNPTSKEITTLGRGGSDTTAMAFAKYFKGECRIFKDVPGICNADPKKFSRAKFLSHISHNQLLNLGNLGSQILHVPAIEMARDLDLTYQIVNANDPSQFTTVSNNKYEDLKSISTVKPVTLVSQNKMEFLNSLNSNQLICPSFISFENSTFFWGNFEITRPILDYFKILAASKKIKIINDLNLTSLFSEKKLNVLEFPEFIKKQIIHSSENQVFLTSSELEMDELKSFLEKWLD
jgi:aspartate kinase